VLGALAGFFGGKIGDFLEWLYNVFTAVPDILLIFAFAAVLGRGVGHRGADPGADRLDRPVPPGARRVHQAFGREYVRAAEAIGASPAARMFRHILPNVSHVILVRMSLLVVGFIKSEVILSYLGLGVPIDQVSWGTMLAEAQGELILGHWWQLATATAFMAVFVTAFSLMADGWRDALDPSCGVPNDRTAGASRTCGSEPSAWVASGGAKTVVPAKVMSRASASTSPRTPPWRWWASRARARASPR
jgi:oligopeptide transport system permease protein